MQGKLLLIAGIVTLGLFAVAQLNQKTEKPVHDHFKGFVAKFGRAYASPSEVEFRRRVFAQHLATIEAHNAKGKSFTMGVNQFTDLTYEEMFSFYVSQQTLDNTEFTTVSANDVPKDKADWNACGKVAAVKNQGQCGSCWAFSAVGALESFYAIKDNTSGDKIQQFAEQDLVDCSKKQGNNGCNGGLMNYAYDYVKANKISNEADYAYTARDGKCRKVARTATLSAYKYLPTVDVAGLLTSIKAQPVAIAMEVIHDFFHYKSGIYKPSAACGGSLNHGVLAVGFDTTVSDSFVLIKNSWGTTWGESGFVRMAVGTGAGTCGIANKWDVLPVAA